uniref:Uncharacterized protein n=1 Tax=Rhizophora mucronata TaxID=61149 RepID=A0A2P2N2U1_RHIMU
MPLGKTNFHVSKYPAPRLFVYLLICREKSEKKGNIRVSRINVVMNLVDLKTESCVNF